MKHDAFIGSRAALAAVLLAVGSVFAEDDGVKTVGDPSGKEEVARDPRTDSETAQEDGTAGSIDDAVSSLSGIAQETIDSLQGISTNIGETACGIAQGALGSLQGVSTNLGEAARGIGQEVTKGAIGFFSGLVGAAEESLAALPVRQEPAPPPPPPRSRFPIGAAVLLLAVAAAAAFALRKFGWRPPWAKRPASAASLPGGAEPPPSAGRPAPPLRGVGSDVFISYSRRDLAVVRSIRDELESLGISCWMDLDGIESGNENFKRKIVPALDGCGVVLFFVSADSQKSEWTAKELGYASRHRKRVVPVRFNDDPLVGEFDFDYGGANIIDWRVAEQRSNLLRDLNSWVPGARRPEDAAANREKPASPAD